MRMHTRRNIAAYALGLAVGMYLVAGANAVAAPDKPEPGADAGDVVVYLAPLPETDPLYLALAPIAPDQPPAALKARLAARSCSADVSLVTFTRSTYDRPYTARAAARVSCPGSTSLRWTLAIRRGPNTWAVETGTRGRHRAWYANAPLNVSRTCRRGGRSVGFDATLYVVAQYGPRGARVVIPMATSPYPITWRCLP